MLKFNFIPNTTNNIYYPTAYPVVLYYEVEFKIEINKKIFFSEPYFSIFEFILYIDMWLNAENKSENMLYNSISTEDNPLISFINNDGEWSVSSPWQLFDCEATFTREELEQATNNLKEVLSKDHLQNR